MPSGASAQVNSIALEQVSASRALAKLQRKLRGRVGAAISTYGMICDGDRVMVCMSGGKDSYALLDILLALQRAAPIRFDLFAVNLDQKQPGFPTEVLPNHLSRLGVEHYIIEEDTYSITKARTPAGGTLCRVCSRLRRGILYSAAAEHGATRIALGHHLDDAVETLFLNMFFGARLKAMPPKLLSDENGHVVIRPMFLVRESDIVEYSGLRGHPIIPCTLCGSQEHLQRKQIKQLLRVWDRDHPGRVENIGKSMASVIPSHLADVSLHDFHGLEGRGLNRECPARASLGRSGA